MAVENGVWIMRGLGWNDPGRIQSWEELAGWIDEVGFLPLFKNEAEGFSVEEHTASGAWWSGDPERDPWEWRCLLARSGRVAYGKFFGQKAGFISKAWFPHFANWRREGYDFDSRWDDERASIRQKRVMDCFLEQDEWFSFALKQRAGLGGDRAKNFEGVVAGLQMPSYLLVREFRQRVNRKGAAYGWPIAVYATPEELWGYAHVTSAYSADPAESKRLIEEQVGRQFPRAAQEELDAALGRSRS